MILVTGGAGFIGSHLCKRLMFSGYDVISLDDYSTGSHDNHVPGVTYLHGHTTDIAKVISEVPDVIFHLGEYSRVESSFDDSDRVYRSNEEGTRAVRHFWQYCRCKLVYAGSSTAFATDRSVSPYAATKRANVELTRVVAKHHDLPSSITYFYNVYGPGERPACESGTVIETFRQQYLACRPLTVVAPGTQRRNFTHVSDIVEGLMLAMEHDGEFAIGASESYSVLQVAQMFGGPIDMLEERKGNRMDSTIDTSAIRALGWTQKHKLEDYINEIKGHPCPFQQDVHNDDEFRCTCSEDQTQECADSI
jgi:UDP-glucose 4-epimerase